MVEGLREELLDMEMRLRNGGLGGVDNFKEWEKKIQDASTLSEFVSEIVPFYAYFYFLIFIEISKICL